MISRKKISNRNLPQSTKNEDLENLLVFGYQCNIFRDDEKAMFIDQGKHLIPWMDEESLLIDRYDGRGHLHDLTPYDAEITRERWEPLTDREKQLEAMIDEERYLELRTDIAERMLYEEEELKRLNEALLDDNFYAAVGFNYEEPQSNEIQETEQYPAENAEDEDDASPYVPIAGLQLPTNMIVPSTMKMHAIIEKTAAFISKQGAQLEIVIKTKQKDNPQFQFLNYEDELNPYYKHLIHVIKQGKYVPSKQEDKSENSNSYLHPTLMSSESNRPEIIHISSQDFLNSVQSKLPAGQINNTSYAKLLSNLSKHAPPRAVEVPRSGLEIHGQSMPLTQPPPPPPPVVQTERGFDQSRRNGSGSSLNSTERNSMSKNASSTSFNENGKQKEHGPAIVPPPPDQQPIIDKMADYVARNGPEFEIVVRMKNDERFRFLEDNHVLHNYYVYKKNFFLKKLELQKAVEKIEEQIVDNEDEDEVEFEEEDEENEVEEKENHAVEEKSVEKENVDDNIEQENKSMLKSVSFSIKMKEEEAPALKKRTAMLYESSDEEVDGAESKTSQSDSESIDAPAVNLKGSSRSISKVSSVASSVDKLDKQPPHTTEDIDKKQAEKKLADKLAVAARSRLVHDSREKQLQAQRKRRAALFLTKLKEDQTSDPDLSVPSDVAIPAFALDKRVSAVSTPDSYHSRSATPTWNALEQVVVNAGSKIDPAVIRISPNSDDVISSLVPSPARKVESKRRSKSRSPRRRSRSPKRRSRSPRRKSRSPKRKSRSPKRKSRSPKRKSRSPKRKSRSPKRKSRSPKRKSRSPGRKRTSHRKRLKTPPSSYNIIRRSISRSPVRRKSPSITKSKHKLSRRSRSRSNSQLRTEKSKHSKKSSRSNRSRSVERKSKRSNRESRNESKKHSSSSRRKHDADKESRKHKKSKRSRRDSSGSNSSPVKRSKLSSLVSAVEPIVVDLTASSPREVEIDSSSVDSSVDSIDLDT